MQRGNNPYSYTDAGFNGFMRRSISSNVNDRTLSAMRRNSTNVSSLNFDNMQVSGNLGDQIEVGKVLIDGVNSRIDGRESNDEVVWRLGNIEE